MKKNVAIWLIVICLAMCFFLLMIWTRSNIGQDNSSNSFSESEVSSSSESSVESYQSFASSPDTYKTGKFESISELTNEEIEEGNFFQCLIHKSYLC